MYNRNDNYVESSNSLVPTVLKDMPNFNALLSAQSDSMQNIEDVLYAVMEDTYFLTAKGYNLNRYGSLFGITRAVGTPDEDFRWLIITQIARRGSTGNIEQVRQLFEAVTGQTNSRVFNIPMLSFMYYGYIDNFTYDTYVPRQAAIALRYAMPPTIGSVIYGVADVKRTLFVPEELVEENRFLVTQDDDYIVNETDDYIITRTFSTQSVAVDNTSGVLAEFTPISKSQLFAQEENPDTSLYQDPFIVALEEEATTYNDDFYVEGVGIDNTAAIMLEINQIYYDEVLPK